MRRVASLRIGPQRVAAAVALLTIASAAPLSAQELVPPERWDPDWHLGSSGEFEVREVHQDSVRLRGPAEPPLWELVVEGFAITYGKAAIEALQSGSVRLRRPDRYADTRRYQLRLLHDKLAAGERLRPAEAWFLGAWLLETGAVDVTGPDGQRVRSVRILEYSYGCLHRGNCGGAIRAFYLPSGRLWFHLYDLVH